MSGCPICVSRIKGVFLLRFALYGHGGSDNHGCEALAKTTARLVRARFPDARVSLLSYAPEEDEKAGAVDFDRVVAADIRRFADPAALIKKPSFEHTRLFTLGKVSRPRADLYYYSLPYRKHPVGRQLVTEDEVYLSIGGDNYCYGEDISGVIAMNFALKKAGKKTVLWGCSVGEEDLTPHKLRDLATYNLITARESVTYNTLKARLPHSRLYLHADPAFTLEAEVTLLPPEFIPGRTVGLNLSPLLGAFEPGDRAGIGRQSFQNLMEFILTQTDYSVALIPHVVKRGASDLEPLGELYAAYKHTGRVCLLDADARYTAAELKGVIARCSLFVGARTHATIAAYSSEVPTLVLGYSVKSRGIAKDLFGDDTDLVVPVNSLTDETRLTSAFGALMKNADRYKARLRQVLPATIESARAAAERLETL